jgi:phasin family protein
MSTLPEQFSAARKAQVETQLDYVRTLTSKVVESTEKVIALNLSTSRAALEKSSATLRQLFSAKDPRDLITLTTQSQTSFESLLAYGSELFSIASGAQGALLKAPPAAALAAPQLAPVTQLSAVPVAPVAEVEVDAQVEVEPTPAPVVAAAVAPTPDLAEEAVPVPEEIAPTPAAKAVSEAVAEPEIPVLSAAPILSEATPELKVSGIEPVEARKPTAQAQDKQLDMLTSKSRKKK